MKFFTSLFACLFIILSMNALAAEPTVQASNISFTNITDTQMRVVFTKGNGAYRILVAKATATPSQIALPVDGNDYTASASFGSGSDLGSGTFVLYEGTNRAVTVTGLTAGTAYSFEVFEFNGTGATTDYLTTTASNNPRYIYTVTTNVSGLAVSNTTATGFRASWNAPSGNYTGYQIDVATDAAFTNLLTNYNHLSVGLENNPAYIDVTGLTQSTGYYWRVRTVSNGQYSTWVNFGSPTVVYTYPAAPTVASVNICTGLTAVLTPSAPAPASNTFKFYADPTGGTALATGASYTTPAISAVTTYYVSAVNNATTLESQTRTAVTVTPIAFPAPSITGDVTTCANQTAVVYSTPNVAGNTYVWTITGGTITAGAGTNSITVTWNNAGSGTVGVTETNPTGCSKAASKAVTVQAIPNPVITGPTSVCQNVDGISYSIATTANAINWEVTGGTITSGQQTRAITVVWTAVGTGKVKVTETTTGGCSKTTADYSVTVVAPPTPNVTGPTSVCATNAGYTYTTANNLNDSYVWTVTGGTISAGAGTNTITVTWGAAGTGTVKVRETNSTGCFTENTLSNVVINALPATTITGSASVCANVVGSTYSVGTVVANNTYAWTVTGGTVTAGAGTSSITVTWGAAGSGSVRLVESTPAGCSLTVTKAVTVNAIPTVAITGNATVCANSTVTYSVVNNTGSTYAWTITGGTITAGATTSSITVHWGVAGTGTLTATETSAAGCSASNSLNVTINAIPAPAIVGNAHLCVNASGQVYTTALTAGNTYAWTIVGGRITAGDATNSVTVTWDSVGIQSLSVTETTTAGCPVSALLPIDIEAYPVPVITGNSTVCNTTTNTYSVVKNADDEYAWTVTGGTIISGQGTESITVTWLTAGNRSVSVTEETAAGCTASATKSVTVNTMPAPSITGNATVTEFDENVAYSTPLVAGHNYSWSVVGGEIVSGDNTNAITVNWGENGTGFVTVVENTTSGCENEYDLTVTINRGSFYRLAVTSTVARQTSGTPFNITVQSQTTNGTPINVADNTPVTISVNTGTGTVSGAGTILAGTSSVILSVTYTKSTGETGVVLSANGPLGMTSGLTNSFTVLAPEPSQASAIVWTSATTNSIGLSWRNGNGSARLVLAKKSTSFASGNNPADGNAYVANSEFGDGSNINGAYVVYKGSDNSVTVTGLESLTRYWFKVFEFNGNDANGTVNYNLNSVLSNPKTRMTPRIPGVGPDYANVSEDGSFFMSQVTPNPAKDKLHFDIELAEETSVSVSVLTVDGRTILNPVNGEYMASGISHSIDVNLGKLAAGSYILMVQAGDQMIMETFIVLP